MAANITASSGNSTGAVEAIRSQRGVEIVKLVGSSTAANDTSNAFVSRLQNPAICVGGPFSISVSGQSVTFTALFALGSNTVYVMLMEAQ
jgi:hypothetical protein